MFKHGLGIKHIPIAPLAPSSLLWQTGTCPQKVIVVSVSCPITSMAVADVKHALYNML